VLQRLHLVRHGEVYNPGEVVYAALPGFGLSTLGIAQAAAAADHLSDSHAVLVVASPLQRAVETATRIADRLAIRLRLDDRLVEWGLAQRWAGVAWADLPERFPGELEAYLRSPTDLPFATESIAEVAERMVAVVSDLDAVETPEAILVSHQDPLQALRLALTDRGLMMLAVDRPGHAAVITLDRIEDRWTERRSWSPPGPSSTFPPSGP